MPVKILVLPSYVFRDGRQRFFLPSGCRRLIARTARAVAPSRSTACCADSPRSCRRRVDRRLITCREFAISSIAAFTSSFTMTTRLSVEPGGLWQDPRQPRQLLIPTDWSGPFACLRTRAVRLFCFTPPFLLFDPVSKCTGVRADSLIARHDRHKLRRFTEQLRRRQVDGVERTNWFDGKGPTNPVQHSLIDLENEATPFERSKGAHRRPLILRRQPTRCSGTDDCSSRF